MGMMLAGTGEQQYCETKQTANSEDAAMPKANKHDKENRRKKKLREREQRKQSFIPASQRPADPNTVMGTCVDCGEACLLSDIFMVQNETWAEAGLVGWDAGHLHLACFKRRLGRELKPEELLAHAEGSKLIVRPGYNYDEFVEQTRNAAGRSRPEE